MNKSIERIKEYAHYLGDEEDRILKLLPYLELRRTSSIRMTLFLLSYMCEYVALHSTYRAEAERKDQVLGTQSTAQKLKQIRESEKNYRLVLSYRVTLLENEINNAPHSNRYSGEHHD